MSKTLEYDFEVDKSLAARIGPTLSIVRASTATYRDGGGVLQEASANQARFDHDYAGVSLGLLIEAAATNLCTWSETFTNAIWLKSGATIDADAGLAPDGTTTMARLNVNTTFIEHRVAYNLVTTTAGFNYCFSTCVKADGAEFVALCFADGSQEYFGAVFDLNTGEVTQENTGSTAGILNSAGSLNMGNGIFRIWIAGSISGGLGTTYPYIGTCNSGTPTMNNIGMEVHSPAAGEDLLMWGAQCEAGPFMSSYIPTAAATVTRSKDDIDTSDVSWYNNSAGTFFTAGSTPNRIRDGGISCVMGEISDNGNANRLIHYMYNTAGNGSIRWDIVSALGTNANLTVVGILEDNETVRAVSAQQANDAELYVNGSRAASGISSVAMPDTPTRLNIGSQYNEVAHWSGHIKQVAYWDERLPDAEIERLSRDGLPDPLYMAVARRTLKGPPRKFIPEKPKRGLFR